MLVKCSLEVPFGLPAVRLGLRGLLEPWWHPLLVDARARSQQLLGEVGLEPRLAGSGDVRVEIEDALVTEHRISIPFLVRIDGAQGHWPSFEGMLISAWFGEQRSQLVFAAQYEPPAGLQPGEAVLLHRVVDAVSREFLSGLAKRLAKRVPHSGCWAEWTGHRAG